LIVNVSPFEVTATAPGSTPGRSASTMYFVGEFAGVDVWRPRTVAGDSGKWENGLVDDGSGRATRAHLPGWCRHRCAFLTCE
jgi:hypothetical protein